MRRDHLAQRLQRRRRAFLRDQEHRIDLARRIVEGHDQIHRRQAFDPHVPRAVLMQHHAAQRTPLALLAMRAALARRPHQTRHVQMQLGHRVAEPVVVPLQEVLVEMLHREVCVLVPVKPEHPLQLRRWRPLRRRPPQPSIGKTCLALLLIPLRPALEGAHVDAQHLRRLLLADLTPLLPLKQTRKTHPTHTLVNRCRAHRAPFVPGNVEHDTSRATNRRQFTS